jgi:hypothetical protein
MRLSHSALSWTLRSGPTEGDVAIATTEVRAVQYGSTDSVAFAQADHTVTTGPLDGDAGPAMTSREVDHGC